MTARPRTPLPPRRRHRRVGHPRRRRQGQGPEGGRRAGHRLRRRRARLPDARPHRRGRRRRLPRPQEPPLHARPAGCPSCKEAIAAKTLRDSGYEVLPGQVLVTNGGKHAVYNTFAHAAEPGRRGAAARAVLDDLPRADRAGRAARRSCCRPTRPTGFRVTVDQLEAARTARTKAARVRVAVEPDGRRVPRAEVEAIGAVGRRARHLGRHRRDLRAPHLRRPPSSPRCRPSCPSWPTAASCSTAWPRPTP